MTHDLRNARPTVSSVGGGGGGDSGDEEDRSCGGGDGWRGGGRGQRRQRATDSLSRLTLLPPFLTEPLESAASRSPPGGRWRRGSEAALSFLSSNFLNLSFGVPVEWRTRALEFLRNSTRPPAAFSFPFHFSPLGGDCPSPLSSIRGTL